LRTLASLMFLLAIACNSADVLGPAAGSSAQNLPSIDTLRELDERAGWLISAARFKSSRKELSDFADSSSHDHHNRSTDTAAWRSSFSSEPRKVTLPDCAVMSAATPDPPGDAEILRLLIANRECSSAFHQRRADTSHVDRRSESAGECLARL